MVQRTVVLVSQLLSSKGKSMCMLVCSVDANMSPRICARVTTGCCPLPFDFSGFKIIIIVVPFVLLLEPRILLG